MKLAEDCIAVAAPCSCSTTTRWCVAACATCLSESHVSSGRHPWEGGLETSTDWAAVEVHRRLRVYGIVPSVVSPSAAVKSVTRSTPLPPLKRSAPDPPVSRSPLEPPPKLSSPAPPDNASPGDASASPTVIAAPAVRVRQWCLMRRRTRVIPHTTVGPPGLSPGCRCQRGAATLMRDIGHRLTRPKLVVVAKIRTPPGPDQEYSPAWGRRVLSALRI
jgi:hypothetical protein